MPRRVAVPTDFLQRLGEPRREVSGCKWWFGAQLAAALGCSEQSIFVWARQGKIPRGALWEGTRQWSEKDVKTIAHRGVRAVNHYSQITPGEVNRLMRPGRSVPRALRAAKKRGVK